MYENSISQASRSALCACALGAAALFAAPGCGDASEGAAPGPALPYATEVVAFSPGPGAGWGAEHLPDVVLGPPEGALREGAANGRDQVLSLGAGGEVVLAFGGAIVDGPGADFVVFENPFWIRNDPEDVWYELGEVSVSEDGETWHTFSCAVEGGDKPGQWPGCAGWIPTKVYSADTLIPIDPEITGGNPFDLADLGVASARFVRIRDLQEPGTASDENAGFDLDAVGIVHLEVADGDPPQSP